MKNCTEAGVTLIEVLIAVLVLGVGMIGTISLQGLAKQGNFEALQRTQAVLIANDISERMAANRGQGSLNDYVGSYSGTLSAPSTSCFGSAADCSNAQLAAWDIYQFDQAILGASQLIDGDRHVGGMINAEGCINNSDGLVTIVIAWQGTSLSSPPDNPIDSCGSSIDSKERRLYVLKTFVEELP